MAFSRVLWRISHITRTAAASIGERGHGLDHWVLSRPPNIRLTVVSATCLRWEFAFIASKAYAVFCPMSVLCRLTEFGVSLGLIAR